MPSDLQNRPYKVYRAGPRRLRSILRGEEEAGVGGQPPGDGGRRWFGRRKDPGERKPITVLRVIKWVALFIVGWLLLSVILFVISAQIQTGNLPSSASNALTGGPNMLTGTDTILILGTDQRPATGIGSKEPGANTNDAGSRSDTIMLWRIGGGSSRRLSIPRDTVADIPGHGRTKINAAYAFGGPALAIRTVEQFTGVKINHVIVVNLAAFPQFIDAIGGVGVTTPKLCANISGGVSNGGFTLNLPAGDNHLNGQQALIYARARENPCDPAAGRLGDLLRVQHQQQILNAIKGQLLSPFTFPRLPIASWDAPKVLRTDMGGPTLLTLFAASEIGGSAPPQVLKVGPVPGSLSDLEASPADLHSAVTKLMNG
jgi:LCP family protein required for cell wall assembly